MPDLPFVVLVPLLLIGVPAALLLAAAIPIIRMSADSLRVVPVEGPRRETVEKLCALHEAISSEMGLEWVGVYSCDATPAILIGAWASPDDATFQCVYHIEKANRSVFDVVTLYEQNAGLTTSSSKDAHTMPPRPMAFIQSFDQAELRTLWQRHLEADRHMRDAGFAVREAGLAFEDALADAMREHARHIRTLPMWTVQMLHRYFALREKLTGQPVDAESIRDAREASEMRLSAAA